MSIEHKKNTQSSHRGAEGTSRLRGDADIIIQRAIAAVQPDTAVRRTLEGREFGGGRVVLVAAGKAAWQMAHAAYEVLGERIDDGVVITKYHHSRGGIGRLRICEAGHPVPDANSFMATQEALSIAEGLGEKDVVLFLLSGGGSALFESPKIASEALARLTEELLASGADITEINTVRKRVSKVKGGRFALACAPAKVVSIILSDIIGDPLDMIASGPAYPDVATCAQAKAIAAKYRLTLTDEIERCLSEETPKVLSNVETHVNGSVKELVRAAADAAAALGYRPVVLTDCLDCEAREAGRFLAAVARAHQDAERSLAFIAGGETVVHLTGKGKGGRNQEIAVAGGIGIAGLIDTAIFSVGSDGTDGPTDAAGGYADGGSFGGTVDCAAGDDFGGMDDRADGGPLGRADDSADGGPLREGAPGAGAATVTEAEDALRNNDTYPLLQRTGGLIITGPTGTNVNDVAVVLIRRDKQPSTIN